MVLCVPRSPLLRFGSFWDIAPITFISSSLTAISSKQLLAVRLGLPHLRGPGVRFVRVASHGAFPFPLVTEYARHRHIGTRVVCGVFLCHIQPYHKSALRLFQSEVCSPRTCNHRLDHRNHIRHSPSCPALRCRGCRILGSGWIGQYFVRLLYTAVQNPRLFLSSLTLTNDEVTWLVPSLRSVNLCIGISVDSLFI